MKDVENNNNLAQFFVTRIPRNQCDLAELGIGPEIEHYFLLTVSRHHINGLPSQTFLLIDNKPKPTKLLSRLH